MVGQEGNQKEYPITGRIKFSPDIPLHSLRFTIGRGIPRSPFQIRTERNTKYVNNIPGGGNPRINRRQYCPRRHGTIMALTVAL